MLTLRWMSLYELLDVIQRNDEGHVVDRFLRIKEVDGEFQVLVSWKGMGAADNSWEPLLTLFYDVPVKLKAFLRKKSGGGALGQRALIYLRQISGRS